MIRVNKPLIIPIFLPFFGCKNRCIFCSQKEITESDEQKTTLELDRKVREFLNFSKPREHNQIAFYAGTFSSGAEERQEEYLRWASSWIKQGKIDSIRISTRPDEITPERLKEYRNYGVKTIELGVQSFDQTVLAANRREYSHDRVEGSLQELRQQGFEIGIHLMTGMFASTKELDWASIKETVRCKPDFVRVHPTLVLKGTELEEVFLKGWYTPPSLSESVDFCADACIAFEESEIAVARFGLMLSENQRQQIVAGPYHPAFGDLVRKKAASKRIFAGNIA